MEMIPSPKRQLNLVLHGTKSEKSLSTFNGYNSYFALGTISVIIIDGRDFRSWRYLQAEFDNRPVWFYRISTVRSYSAT
jgi:hypothetical protein